MKIGIVTLVGDNYGNKFQNYAVEQLLKEYGTVETFRVERSAKLITSVNKTNIKNKLNYDYVKRFLRSRLMSKYDLNNTSRPVFFSVLYALLNHKKLIELKTKRSQNFKNYQDEYLNVSERIITTENCRENEWLEAYDCFFCGSDQIWNPTYATTSELAFLSFAQGRAVALAPSFGVSKLPNDVCEKYKKWIEEISVLSVREKAGQNIIYDLTGRKAELLFDPTMAIAVEDWKECAKNPGNLPEKYVLCYFLGKVSSSYKENIEKFARERNLNIVKLFDIESTDYYTYGPNEVLYSILHAEYVLTDSFHGSVFSILFKRNFFVFNRDEGGQDMSSRLDTLLESFDLQDRKYGITDSDISISKWNKIDEVLEIERKHTKNYIDNAIYRIKKERR